MIVSVRLHADKQEFMPWLTLSKDRAWSIHIGQRHWNRMHKRFYLEMQIQTAVWLQRTHTDTSMR